MDEIGATVVWLLGRGSGFSTGAIIPIDGGVRKMNEPSGIRRECERASPRVSPKDSMHYRHVHGNGASRPTLMMHASPASSRSVEPLALAVAQIGGGRVIAPGVRQGNGDSVPLTTG
jgi:hypothetical protein